MERIAQLQQEMAKEGLDCVIVRLSENVLLLSRYWPRSAFSFVAVPRVGDALLALPETELSDLDSCAIAQVCPFPWLRLRDGDPYAHLAKTLGGFATQNGLHGRVRVGLETDADCAVPPLCAAETLLPGKSTLRMLRSVFPQATFESATAPLARMKAIKTPYDLARLARANEIAREGVVRFRAMLDAAPVTEIALAAAVEHEITLASVRHADVCFARAWAQVSSGPQRTAMAWCGGMISTARMVQTGELALLELATVVDGYYADLTCTHHRGAVDARKCRLLDGVRAALEQALTHAGPATGGAIDALARAELTRRGLGDAFLHGSGHGVGFSYHEPFPRLTPDSQDAIVAGMVHSIEPGVYLEGVGGVRQEVNVHFDGHRWHVL